VHDQNGKPHLLRVGDVARSTGKTVRAIHLYEELGLLQPATRSSGGFRLYEATAIERVRWIDLLHSMGFSLQEMRRLLRSWWSADLGPEAMSELRALFQKKLEGTRAAIERHRQMERELVESLSYLETCRECASPSTVRACLTCSQDHGTPVEPALLAGLKSAPEAGRRSPRSGFVRIEEIE
jgi:DNA-binding transcriptional MerR regulator